MIILGLGSNVGNRMANLRKAYAAITNLTDVTVVKASPVYISEALLPDNAPADWNKPYLNCGLQIETALSPDHLLKELKNIEWSIGRKPEIRHWGPRIIDIDILAFNNSVICTEALTVPHSNLQQRPFALWPLADLAPLWRFPLTGPNEGKTAAEIVEIWGSRFSGEAPFRTRQIYQRIDTPQLVGVLNITPDSFSDGGLFNTVESALAQANELITAGAEVIDIGAESTAPRASPLSAEIEWQRLEPVLQVIKQQSFFITPTISIDTRHAEVAKKALLLGVDWINDVSGLDDPAMCALVAANAVDCVVMHHLTIPERRTKVIPRTQDPAKLVYEWGEQRIAKLEKEGIPRERIIFDPGIGFGKMAEQSMLVLKASAIYKKLGTRILVGPSRKTFLNLVTAHPYHERDIETMVTAICLAHSSVDYLRVHNPEFCARGVRVYEALR